MTIKVKRVPISNAKAFYPLAELVVEAYTKNGWQEITLASDETYALLCSGRISIMVDSSMEPCVIEAFEGYYLRLRLTRCDYDVPPVIEAIRFNLHCPTPEGYPIRGY